jgi:hypothetical protein
MHNKHQLGLQHTSLSFILFRICWKLRDKPHPYKKNQEMHTPLSQEKKDTQIG